MHTDADKPIASIEIPADALEAIANAACRRPYPHPPHAHEIGYRDFLGQYWCDGVDPANPDSLDREF